MQRQCRWRTLNGRKQGERLKSKALRKDFYMEIKKTYNRFLSIFLIVALGVAFFSGIRASKPDMELSADKFYDENNYMDVRVLSTLGLTDEDVEALGEVEGIGAAIPSYSTDVLSFREDGMYTLKVFSMSEEINEITPIKGRLPERTGECILDTGLEELGYKVGDTIQLASGTEDDISDSFRVTEYEVVGMGITPAYLSLQRENSRIGRGYINGFMAVLPENFDLEAYTEIYLSVDGAKALVSYREDYQDLVDTVVDRIEEIKADREEARYQSIKADADKEIADAEEELADGKKEAEEKLSDAYKKLADGKKELADAKKELADGRQEIADNKQKLLDAQKDIAAGKKKLAQGKRDYEKGKKELAANKKKLQEKKQELAKGKKELAAQRKTFEEQKAKLEAEKRNLAAQKKNLATQKGTLAAQRENLEAEKKSLAAQKEGLAAQEAQFLQAKAAGFLDEATIAATEQELAAGKEQIAAGEAMLLQAEEQLVAGEQQIAAGEKQLAAGEAELSAAEQKLAAGEGQLVAGERELAAGEKQLAAGEKELAKAEKQLSKALQTIKASERELAAGQRKIDRSWNDIAKAEREIADGETELLDGEKKLVKNEKKYWKEKAKAEKEIADGEKELADAKQELADLERPEWYVLGREYSQVYAEFGQNAERIGAIGEVFPVFFFLIAALVCLTTMTRMVEEERLQIGTLKALGYSKASIAAKYLLYAGLASLGGGIFGALAGQKVLPFVIVNAYRMMYVNLPYCLLPYNIWYSVSSVGVVMACTVFAAYFACAKELRSNAAELMRPEAPKAGKRVLLEKVGFLWKRLSFGQKASVRNLFRYKKRFFMTIIGIGGCMALLLVGFGLRDSIFNIASFQYGDLFVYSGSIIKKEDATEQEMEKLRSFLDGEGNVESYLSAYQTSVDVGAGSVEKNAYLVCPETTEGFDAYVKLRDRLSKEEYFLAEDMDGIILTEKVASMLGVKAGDEVMIKLDETTRVSAKILHLTENYSMHYIYMAPKLYEALFGEMPEYNFLYYRADDDSEAAEEAFAEEVLGYEAASEVQFNSQTRETVEDMLDSLNIVVCVLIISAGLLAFVVLYNLNNININERRRELATLRVLGFFNPEVGAYVYRESVMLTVIGTAVGIFLGIALHRYVILTAEIDMLMFGRRINWLSYLYSAVLTMLFSALINWIMYFKLKKIDMVESLKSIE